MFYGQCWKCGERWELGTASTCKCPEETTIEWTEAKLPSPVLTLDTKPNHNMTFHNQDGKQVGELNFNGPEMTFTGDADESAKVFFDWISKSFKGRLGQERAEAREACAKLCDEYQNPFEGRAMADAIRARGNT